MARGKVKWFSNQKGYGFIVENLHTGLFQYMKYGLVDLVFLVLGQKRQSEFLSLVVHNSLTFLSAMEQWRQAVTARLDFSHRPLAKHTATGPVPSTSLAKAFPVHPSPCFGKTPVSWVQASFWHEETSLLHRFLF